ncbi:MULTISPECIES: stressosome-associated protein Prli42 [Laceyella]|uniref:Stressosome-associated protein Prli42 n=1 Tax=Laceyella sacchari TaxID=37482 RepID=A0ABY5U594_LACSH|nr:MULTISPECIES: stressosome-associated protein Prli42 [Laceyella]UWE04808.1 stressosome-associated protein Prli42 [Laceyella sacchari]
MKPKWIKVTVYVLVLSLLVSTLATGAYLFL